MLWNSEKDATVRLIEDRIELLQDQLREYMADERDLEEMDLDSDEFVEHVLYNPETEEIWDLDGYIVWDKNSKR